MQPFFSDALDAVFDTFAIPIKYRNKDGEQQINMLVETPEVRQQMMLGSEIMEQGIFVVRLKDLPNAEPGDVIQVSEDRYFQVTRWIFRDPKGLLMNIQAKAISQSPSNKDGEAEDRAQKGEWKPLATRATPPVSNDFDPPNQLPEIPVQNMESDQLSDTNESENEKQEKKDYGI